MGKGTYRSRLVARVYRRGGMTGLECLVAALFFEARDQPPFGIEMVAETIMNRVASARYPDDVCSVVYQKRQFSFTHDGMSDDPHDYDTYFDKIALQSVKEIAVDYIEGASQNSGVTHYHTTSVYPSWSKSMEVYGIVGDHIFYVCNKRC